MRGPKLDAFDAGMGRCLWFIFGGDPDAIGHCIDDFPEARRPNLWSGSGLACCYAGGVDREAVFQLIQRAARYRDALAQGACFAAKARQHAALRTLA